LPEGRWQTFHENGEVATDFTYVKGKRTGLYERRYDKGKLEITGRYIDNKKDSVWTEYYENGRIREQGAFTEGKMIGTHSRFTPASDVAEEVFYGSGSPRAYVKRYYPNRKLMQEGKLINQEQDSVWMMYRPDGGPFQREVYVEGRLQEASIAQSEGKDLPASSFAFGQNKPRKIYRTNGTLAEEGMYLLGQKEGLWREFSEKGKRIAEGSYSAGLKDGVWMYYDERGRKTQRGTFTQGDASGIWEVFDKKGNVAGTLVVD
jgi:antitoxin component YwqK of YwqJK toxin-antitoxin module